MSEIEPREVLSSRVVNVGTTENSNYFGSAEAIGRLRGIREALEAVKNCKYTYDEYAHDACIEAVEALLPK